MNNQLFEAARVVLWRSIYNYFSA